MFINDKVVKKQNYEMMYILSTKLDNDKQKQKIENINKFFIDNQIELTKSTELGLKEFAYPIKKENQGYYMLIKFVSEPEKLNVLTHYLRFDNDILRYLIVKDFAINNKKEENTINNKNLKKENE